MFHALLLGRLGWELQIIWQIPEELRRKLAKLDSRRLYSMYEIYVKIRIYLQASGGLCCEK
jgi:hypothetical protein